MANGVKLPSGATLIEDKSNLSNGIKLPSGAVLINDEAVKKKLGGNGLQDGLTNTPSRSQLSLSENTDEENPYSQLLNTHKDNTTASIDVAKSYLKQDFNDRQSKINASPLLQQFDKPLDEGLSLSQAKDEAGKVVVIANPNMSVADYNKGVIFSNPKALKKYRQIRESEINANTSKLKQDESELPEAHRFITKDAQAEYFQNNPEYQQLQSAITKNKDQKDELKKSVANIAKIIIPKEAIESGKPVDIQKIGEDYLKVIGDPQVGDDKKTLRAIDNGLEKPQDDIDRSKQNIQYKFFKTGAGILSDYYANLSNDLYKKAKPKIQVLEKLFSDQEEVKTDESKSIIQNHINDYLQDDDIKNYNDATLKSLDYYSKSQNAAEQFPQVQRAINRQKLNDAFFEWNKIKDDVGTLIPGGAGYNALKYVLGAQPSKDEIPLLASMAGISQEEAQKIYDEKVKGFIGEAPTGVRVDGLLLGLAKSTDETLAKSLMGVRRFLHTDDVEAKNRLLNDRLVNYNLESQQNKLKDDFDKWNINPYSIFNTMGNGIGQTAIYGLPALATGGFTEGVLLKDSKLLASLSKRIVEGSATVATGYAGSYEDSYKEAAKYTDDEKLRRAYANVTAYENALPELLLSPADILKKVGVGKKIGGEAFETFAKDAAKDGIEKTVSQRLVKSLKEFANVVGAENIEEQVTNISNIETKKSQLGVETTPQEAISQAIETAVQTTITTLPLGIGAGMNANNDESGIRKEGLFEAGNEPDLYKEKLKSLLDKGVLNQVQYDKKVQVVNTMQNIVAAVNKTTKANGKPLSYDEKANLAAQQFRIDNNNFILKNNPITANEKIIEADNNEALNIQNEILIGKPINATGTDNQELSTQTTISSSNINQNEKTNEAQTETKGQGVTNISSVQNKEGESDNAAPSFKGLRDDDFASQYFTKEEYKKWSDAEIDNPEVAKQMIANKKEEIKNEPVRTDTESGKNTQTTEITPEKGNAGSNADNELITSEDKITSKENVVEDLQSQQTKIVPPIVSEHDLKNGDKITANISGQKIEGTVTGVGKHKGQIVIDLKENNGQERFVYGHQIENIERAEPKLPPPDNFTNEQRIRHRELLDKLVKGDDFSAKEMDDFKELEDFKEGKKKNLLPEPTLSNNELVLSKTEKPTTTDVGKVVQPQQENGLKPLEQREMNHLVRRLPNNYSIEKEFNPFTKKDDYTLWYKDEPVLRGENAKQIEDKINNKDYDIEDFGKISLKKSIVDIGGEEIGGNYYSLTQQANLTRLFGNEEGLEGQPSQLEKMFGKSPEQIERPQTIVTESGIKERKDIPDIKPEDVTIVRKPFKEGVANWYEIKGVDAGNTMAKDGESETEFIEKITKSANANKNNKNSQWSKVFDNIFEKDINPKPEPTLSNKDNSVDIEKRKDEALRNLKLKKGAYGEDATDLQVGDVVDWGTEERGDYKAKVLEKVSPSEVLIDGEKQPVQISWLVNEVNRKYKSELAALEQPKQDNSVVEDKTKTENKISSPINTEQNTIPPEPPKETPLAETKVGDAARELADKIRQLRPKKGNTVKATIFALPIAIYDTVIVTIANAIEAGASLADAIQKGIDYIHSLSEHSDWEDEGGKFKQHIDDAIEGKKPTVTVQTKPEENAKEEIDDYEMTTSGEVGRMASGGTWEDVFGEAPEGAQSYYVQKLTDMLQDGKNMIAIAQRKWGDDIIGYGKKLFGFLQDMDNSKIFNNKKAVLLATFLGEIKEASLRDPDRFNEIKQLENAVMPYYQNYMNVRGKEVVAGKLLRLYRDKYIGDIFADRILEEKEVKDKRNLLKAEEEAKKIDDLVAAKVKEQLTAQQKKDADAADKKASDKDKKTNDKKKSLTQKDAQAKADKKLSEIKDRLGKDGDKGLIGKINDLVNKLNCK